MDFKFDNLLEYLIPIIFLIVWAIGRLFAPKKEESSEKIEEFEEPEEETIIRRKLEQFEKKYTTPQDFLETPQISLQKSEKIKEQTKAFIHHEYQLIEEEKIRHKKQMEMHILLKGPNALRKAFLTYEILGPPLALRKNGKISRSWQR